jgi:nicotinate-nucleotide adenylyltransferase
MTAERIGILGGTFDPVHEAHVALARTAADHLRLNQLRWIPAGMPWQKTGEMAMVRDRTAMVALAAEGDPRFKLDLMEALRPGPSYTIDTVKDLLQKHPKAELFLIIGQDQYARLHTWHNWRELLSRVTVAVASRNGEAPKPMPEVAALWHRLEVVPMTQMDVSSTAIRAHLAAGGRASELVPHMLCASVARYIDDRGLYGPNPRNVYQPSTF